MVECFGRDWSTCALCGGAEGVPDDPWLGGASLALATSEAGPQLPGPEPPGLGLPASGWVACLALTPRRAAASVAPAPSSGGGAELHAPVRNTPFPVQREWVENDLASEEDDDDFIPPEPTEAINVPLRTKAPQGDGPAREPVLLNVYDLGRTPLTRNFNDVSKDFGAFHTAVEVYGSEWSFGAPAGPDECGSGISWCPPREDKIHSFREAVLLGHTKLSRGEVLEVLRGLQEHWPAGSYSLLGRNCHHFAEALVRELGCGPLPRWINGLASGAQEPEGLASILLASAGSIVTGLFSAGARKLEGALR